jgi:hypothetical protein
VTDVREAITQAHHDEWARVVAALTRRFGDLDIAEEAAAEAFASAVERWPADGVPPNPGAWLTTTGSPSRSRRAASGLLATAAGRGSRSGTPSVSRASRSTRSTGDETAMTMRLRADVRKVVLAAATEEAGRRGDRRLAPWDRDRHGTTYPDMPWEPKQAFRAVADHYRAVVGASQGRRGSCDDSC